MTIRNDCIIDTVHFQWLLTHHFASVVHTCTAKKKSIQSVHPLCVAAQLLLGRITANLWGEYAESNRDRKEKQETLREKKKKTECSQGKKNKKTTTMCKAEKVRRALHGIVAGLSCLQVLRDQPVPPRREGSGLSQHTQAALLAEALWHGCGCCSQSVTARSYSPSPLFSPSHSVILNHPYSTPPSPPPLPPTLTHSQSASHAVWKK